MAWRRVVWYKFTEVSQQHTTSTFIAIFCSQYTTARNKTVICNQRLEQKDRARFRYISLPVIKCPAFPVLKSLFFLDSGPCSARLLTASSAMRLPDVPSEESGREISDGNDWSKVRGFLARCRRYIAFTRVHKGCGEHASTFRVVTDCERPAAKAPSTLSAWRIICVYSRPVSSTQRSCCADSSDWRDFTVKISWLFTSHYR